MWPTLAPPATGDKGQAQASGRRLCDQLLLVSTSVPILGQLSSDFETFSICSALNHNVARDRLNFHFPRRIASERGWVGWGTDLGTGPA